MTQSRIRLIALAAVAIVVFLFVQNQRWSGEAGAERAHRKFLGYVSDRRWGKCQRMIAADYSDRWGFDRKQISLALKDVGRQFTFALEVDWETKSISENQGLYDIVGIAQFDGKGNPAVDLILRETKSYAAHPYTFRWKRDGLLPWKWKLDMLDHPKAEVPPGYVPGDLSSLVDLF